MNWKNIAKIIERIFLTVSILIIIWVFASWVDVILHNQSGGTDAWWNFFKIFLALAE